MSSPPVFINPSDIVSFASLSRSATDKETFDQLYKDVYLDHTSSTGTRSPWFYIIQQPAPNKHRRSFVEVQNLQDLKSRCGRPDSAPSSLASPLDTDNTVIMMLRVPECAGSEALTNSAEIGGTRGGNYVSSGNNLSEDCDPRSPVSVSSDYSQEVDSTLRSMGAHQVANWTSISSDYMVFSMDAPGQTETYEMRAKVDNAVIHSLPQEYTELYKDMDEERDGSEDTGGGQSKRASLVRHSTAGLTISTNPTLPTSFRPLIREGKVQFEIWVVAFLELNPLLQGNAGQAAEATTRDDLRTKDFLPKDPARQHLCSYWTTLLSGFLGCKIVQEYVREQVSKGRIGIDFRRILESRKPTRRTIR